MKRLSTHIFNTNNRGFSLIELIIVIAIMAALIAILAPQYLKYVDKSRTSADELTAGNLYKACTVATADKDFYNVQDGDNVVWNADGSLTVTSSGPAGAAFEDALKEYLGTSTSIAKIKSAKYQSKAPYTVTVNINTSTGVISITDAWAH